MEDKFFIYKSTFNKPDFEDEQKLFFVSEGMDYEFDIVLNGKQVFTQQGMFTTVELDFAVLATENNNCR